LLAHLGDPLVQFLNALDRRVGQNHTHSFGLEQLIGLIERTARESLYPFLENNERTVGVEIEVRHLAPTPAGSNVTILTRVIQAEGKTVDFQFEVRDDTEMIARGLHKRAVITVENFARRVAKKSGRS
jgi:predicted thioesterase